MITSTNIRESLVVDFRHMLAGGKQVPELLARGYAPDLVEAAATGVQLEEMESRNSKMPKSVKAVGQTVMIL